MSFAKVVSLSRKSPFDSAAEAELGPTTTRTMRARYVLRLAAVATLLRELGNKASRIRDAADLDREDEAVRDLLARLDAVAGGYEGSIYERSRDLDVLVAATITGIEERLAPGGESQLRELGRGLSQPARSITRELERAATAAGEGHATRADRLLATVERRLATLGRAV